RSQIIREGVEVVAAPRSARPTVTAPIVTDAAQPVFDELVHLVSPDLCIERPRVQEHDRRTCTPVEVKQLGAVTGPDERATAERGTGGGRRRRCRAWLGRLGPGAAEPRDDRTDAGSSGRARAQDLPSRDRIHRYSFALNAREHARPAEPRP